MCALTYMHSSVANLQRVGTGALVCLSLTQGRMSVEPRLSSWALEQRHQFHANERLKLRRHVACTNIAPPILHIYRCVYKFKAALNLTLTQGRMGCADRWHASTLSTRARYCWATLCEQHGRNVNLYKQKK